MKTEYFYCIKRPNGTIKPGHFMASRIVADRYLAEREFCPATNVFKTRAELGYKIVRYSPDEEIDPRIECPPLPEEEAYYHD